MSWRTARWWCTSAGPCLPGWTGSAVGVMVFNLMRLPRLFPQFEFDIKYFRRPQAPPTVDSGR